MTLPISRGLCAPVAASGFFDFGIDFGGRERRRRKIAQNIDFELLRRRQIVATGGCKLRDRFAPLFLHARDEGEKIAVAQIGARIGRGFLDFGEQHAQRPGAAGIAAFGGGGDLLADVGGAIHARLKQAARQRLHANAAAAALDGEQFFALAARRRLFVGGARAHVGDESGALDHSLEAAHRDFERFVFLDCDGRH